MQVVETNPRQLRSSRFLPNSQQGLVAEELLTREEKRNRAHAKGVRVIIMYVCLYENQIIVLRSSPIEFGS